MTDSDSDIRTIEATPAQRRAAAGGGDSIRRYLVEAAQTPLLEKDQERLLATRMARRRDLFQLRVIAIPAVWGPMVKLVRSALDGSTPPSKVFALGGASEAAFHRHVKASQGFVNRLAEIHRMLCGEALVLRSAGDGQRGGGCRGHKVDRDLLREGRDLAASLKLRIAPMRKLLKQAAKELPARKACRGCRCGIAEARRIFQAFVETRNALVSANLRLVVHIAKQIARHPSQLLDLIQEGNVGLLYATEKYDAGEVCQFHSYAFWWIKQAMTRSIAGKSRLTRQPLRLDEASDRIKEAVKKFREQSGRDPTSDELAGRLDISRHRAQQVFRTDVRTWSLDRLPGGDGEEAFADRLADPHPEKINLDTGWVADGLDEVLTTLTPREREVVELRFGIGHHEHYTLENIAKIYNLSRERVRQIEIKAMDKLREPSRAKRLRELLDALED